jgi:DNA-binding NtrC family response regulator
METGSTLKKRERILVVDQDVLTQDFLASIIKLIGCDVEIVDSVAAALDALEKSAFDLLITDFPLPDFPRLIENTTQKIPLLHTICMVRHRPLMMEVFRWEGADAIPKPFNLDDMIRKIQQAIHKKNLKEVERQFYHLRQEVFNI